MIKSYIARPGERQGLDNAKDYLQSVELFDNEISPVLQPSKPNQKN